MATRKALSKNSGQIIVSGSVTETGANTFTQDEFNMTLDVLNNEVFVVERIDLRTSTPDLLAGIDTSVDGSITKTSQTSVLGIGSDTCIAADGALILTIAATAAVIRLAEPSEVIAGTQEYLNILATNNFFVQVAGGNNANPKSVVFKMWGYRAKADSATYAALVQSELLSS